MPDRINAVTVCCRIEPLGMEYIAAALEADGHQVTIADLRFRPTRALAAAMLQYSEEETPPLTAAASV